MQPKTYPASLPQYPKLGHKEGLPDNLARNKMDSGPPQTRPTSTNPKRPVSMSFHMTDAQKATFVSWFIDTLVQGSLEFVHFLPDAPSTQIVFQFKKEPTLEHKSFDLWLVKYDLWDIREA